MAGRYLWIRNKRYYLWNTYDTWKDAYNDARYYCRKNRKNRYFIQKVESGFLFPQIKYRLYMTRVFKLW